MHSYTNKNKFSQTQKSSKLFLKYNSYRKLIRKLLQALSTSTKPNIAAAVSTLCKKKKNQLTH